ncbi:GlcG/HbpS family heme-binding protein [Henriciella litoralis]|uniref:GlcG/HbpS family heme-binding protein n=1 Tax=Henriciella litoralis TaxID=568102 RepID=UPI000A00B8D5|nr:heme-binding protein [Henriciella litoralis]
MLTLKQSEIITSTVLQEGRARELAPLCVIVLDAGGHLVNSKREDNSSVGRPQIAMGKASGCIGLGVGGRTLAKMAADRPSFMLSVSGAFVDGCVPVAGGVLIRDEKGAILGAVGVTGDTSDNDEACAIAGISAAGLVADAGS